MQTHLKVVAILFIVFGACGLLLAVFSSLLFSVLGGIVGMSGDANAPVGVAMLGLAGIALTAALLIYSIPVIVCGWALLTRRPWARILGIIMAAIGLINYPFGTIFGIYALWVLFNRETEQILAPAHRAV